MGVAQNCESMGGPKLQGGEMDCLPYYLMYDVELREGKK